MTTQTLALLAKNYDNLLAQASDHVASRGFDTIVAFRSEKTWQAPYELLQSHGPTPIYFRSGEGDFVTHQGTLVEVLLDQELAKRRADVVARYALPITLSEAWDDLKSIYLVKALRPVLPEPVGHFTRVDGNQAAKGSYPYTTVHARRLLPASTQLAEEVSSYIEGAVVQVLVNAYERDPLARRACIEHYGPNCFVCGFSFGAAYGLLADGYIHVHHLQPLSEIKTSHVVDPVRDMRPVCPNCHAVLHLGAIPMAIDALKELVNRRGA